MTTHGVLQITLFFVVLVALVKPLGWYMARVFEGKPAGLNRLLAPVERLIYRLCGVREEEEMDWQRYTAALLLFSVVGLIVLYLQQRLQGFLPLNPQELGAVSPDSSLNTAVSFTTNTNWQGYGGETTMSYLTQMLGLAVHNFVSAATGIAILLALIRGFTRRSVEGLGNFWVDLTRSTLYVLLPFSFILALILVAQGVPQTFGVYKTAKLLQPTSYDQAVTDQSGNPVLDERGQTKTETVIVTEQSIAVGPAASQIAIKQLGTNGGGFFNANAAHPLENPTPLSNFLEMLAILLIPAALCYTFGMMVGDTRQGWAILAAMTIVLVLFTAGGYWAESAGNPMAAGAGVDQAAGNLQPGGNMEGKEVRFGIANSVIWAAATTAASNGSVNSMHDSYTPLGGLVPLLLMQFGEVIFGGVGSGLYGMLVFAIIAVFVAGLMVGRTPEYLGKKIEAYEMKMASLLILIMPITVLVLTAVAMATDIGKASIFNPGAHGFSEVLYAFTSMGNNNGSAFAGLGANTPFYNLTGSFAMLVGRFWLAVPTLALAGSLAKKKRLPIGAGTLPTHTPLFIAWLIGVIVIVGALTFFPALALGPIAEHFQ
ncbi:MAG: potassium-transporting ATPase subunit KdpA [Candidatus Manganitrophus sp. SB1]|nr:potassium-transporting ATPase subunit KdpA [Candidatus Manganitrophus morganii]